MKKKVLAMLMAGVLSVSMLAACGDEGAAETTTETEAGTTTETTENVEETGETEDVTFVDGFYANDGNGSDFMIAFYEGAAGDVCYVNDGTNEVFAEYALDMAQTEDGTEYILITVGNTQLGYIEDGEDIYLVDADGNIYAGGRLTEEEADEIYNSLQ